LRKTSFCIPDAGYSLLLLATLTPDDTDLRVLTQGSGGHAPWKLARPLQVKLLATLKPGEAISP
jgi:hypothetical protein